MKTPVLLHRVETYLEGVEYPLGKDKILKYAKVHHVPANILEILEELPDKEYHSLQEIQFPLESIIENTPFDDGVAKKNKAKMVQEKEDKMQQMENIVNPNEFTQMGDEEDHESV